MTLRVALSQTARLATHICTRGSRRQLSTASRLRQEADQSKEKEGPEDMDKLQKNPYFDKYADKIAKLQKTSPEELEARLKAMEEAAAQKASKTGQPVPEEKGFSLPTKPKAAPPKKADVSQLSEKKLSSLMKVELLEGKTKEEVGDIWRQYHVNKDAVAAVIPADVWTSMVDRFQEHRTFLFPLPRKEGYEFVMVQFQDNQAHFTTLINYQAYKENAPECLTIVHYTELAADKGIVLMVGDFDKNFLTIQEAQCLANYVEMFYCNPSQEKRELMDTFTNRPEEFKHADLIAQIENVSLLTAAPQSAAAAAQPTAVAAEAAQKVVSE